MKPTSAFFLFLSLFLLGNLNYARKQPEDYWKSVMKGRPMPEAIRGLFVKDSAGVSNNKMIHFVKDFDTRSIAVIYRKRAEPNIVRADVRDDDDKMKGKKTFVDEHSNPPGVKVPTGTNIDHKQKKM